MRNAKEFRDTAWNSLRGRYWWAVLAALVACVLGGYAANTSLSFRFEHSDFSSVREWFQQAHNFVVSAGILGSS
jgi:hypothetical protein